MVISAHKAAGFVVGGKKGYNKNGCIKLSGVQGVKLLDFYTTCVGAALALGSWKKVSVWLLLCCPAIVLGAQRSATGFYAAALHTNHPGIHESSLLCCFNLLDYHTCCTDCRMTRLSFPAAHE